MATIDIRPQKTLTAPDGRRVQITVIDGAIDASTVVQFETTVHGYLKEGINIVILDCVGLTYINSTGMGLLINLRDKFEARNGQIELCQVPDKVRTLFSMLGIESLYTIHPDHGAALRAAGIGVEAPPPRKKPDTKNLPKPRTPQKKKGVSFPVKISCANCKTKLRIQQPGYYRCPKCQIHYNVSDEARVKAYNTVKPKVVELRVPAETQFCESVRNAARAVAGTAKLEDDELVALEAAVDEATNLLIQRCSAGGRVRFFQVYIVCDERDFVCGFKTTENVFEGLENDPTDISAKLALEMIRQSVSSLDIIDLQPHGQILKLVKRASSKAAAS
ncbi:MAG: STAS domain-containing protein [Planctomycetota bacterium]